MDKMFEPVWKAIQKPVPNKQYTCLRAHLDYIPGSRLYLVHEKKRSSLTSLHGILRREKHIIAFANRIVYASDKDRLALSKKTPAKIREYFLEKLFDYVSEYFGPGGITTYHVETLALRKIPKGSSQAIVDKFYRTYNVTTRPHVEDVLAMETNPMAIAMHLDAIAEKHRDGRFRYNAVTANLFLDQVAQSRLALNMYRAVNQLELADWKASGMFNLFKVDTKRPDAAARRLQGKAMINANYDIKLKDLKTFVRSEKAAGRKRFASVNNWAMVNYGAKAWDPMAARGTSVPNTPKYDVARHHFLMALVIGLLPLYIKGVSDYLEHQL